MLIYVYLFALIVGGILLGASLLLGGHDHEIGAGDGALDAAAEADATAEGAGGGSEAGGHEAAHAMSAASGLDLLWPLRSVRFWTFFLAFFGLTGLVFDGLDLTGPGLALGLAVGVGLLLGGGAAGVIRWLASEQAGRAPRSNDYVGRSARVVVPVKKGGLGKVRVEIGGTSVDVLAVTDDEEGIAAHEEAMIIEMDGTQARVVRAEESVDATGGLRKT